MPGWTSNGLPNVGAPTQNGVLQTPPNGQYPQMSSRALVSVDTETAGGGQPQSVGAEAFYIAAIASALQVNTQTSTVHAATSNTISGRCITEALTTAPGAVYTFTLTNSLILAANAPILFDIRSGSNTISGLVPTSVTMNAGNAVLTFTNTGTAALNGTMILSWHI